MSNEFLLCIWFWCEVVTFESAVSVLLPVYLLIKGVLSFSPVLLSVRFSFNKLWKLNRQNLTKLIKFVHNDDSRRPLSSFLSSFSSSVLFFFLGSLHLLCPVLAASNRESSCGRVEGGGPSGLTFSIKLFYKKCSVFYSSNLTTAAVLQWPLLDSNSWCFYLKPYTDPCWTVFVKAGVSAEVLYWPLLDSSCNSCVRGRPLLPRDAGRWRSSSRVPGKSARLHPGAGRGINTTLFSEVKVSIIYSD